jgi:branched-chain amino acid transport system permease protein
MAAILFWLLVAASVAYIAWTLLRIPQPEWRRAFARGGRILVAAAAIFILVPFIGRTASSQLRPALIAVVVATAAGILLLPRRYHRSVGLLCAAIFLVVVPFFMPSYQNKVLTDYVIFAMAALSLNLLMGMSGEVSLGHGALLAIGGYTTAILVHQHHVSFYVTVLIAALMAAIVGVLLGIPATRLTGPYLAIATLGLAISIPEIGKWVKVVKWTGGPQGINLLADKAMPKVPSFLKTLPGGHKMTIDEYLYFLALFAAVLMCIVAWNFRRSRTGRAVVALRDSEPAAKVAGINPGPYKVLIFTLSAFIAGIAGSFLAAEIQSVHPDTYSLDLSIQILAMVVVGGLDSLLGSVLGAVVIRWLVLNKTSLPAPTSLPTIGKHLPQLFAGFPTYGAGVYYGLALILVMILMPFGVAGALDRIANYAQSKLWFGRQKPAPAAAPVASAQADLPTTTAPENPTTIEEVKPR